MGRSNPLGIAAVAMMMSLMQMSVPAAGAEVAEVDLTQPVPKDAGTLGVFGVNNWTVTGIRFPVEVRIEDVWPATVQAGDRVTVSLVVRNRGSEAVAIPVSRRYGEILAAGNSGKRTLSLQVILTPKGTSMDSAGRDAETLAVTIGAESVDGSIVMLEPGDSVRFKVAGTLWMSMNGWFGGGRTEMIRAEMRCAVSEVYLRDDTYTARKITERAISVNSVELTVAAPRR